MRIINVKFNAEYSSTNILRWTQTESMWFNIEGGDKTYITPQRAGSFEYKIQTSPIICMHSMFDYCSELTELDLSSFDTSMVTNMACMFEDCSGLTKLDLSSFDTSKVADMNYMFSGCDGLTELNLSSFDTTNVTNMGYMFRKCSGLTKLDLSSFDTSNVFDMYAMFDDCSGLFQLDLSAFDTYKVANMGYMFGGCTKLETLTLGSGFDMSNVASYKRTGMFADCTSLKTINAIGINATTKRKLANALEEAGLTEQVSLVTE